MTVPLRGSQPPLPPGLVAPQLRVRQGRPETLGSAMPCACRCPDYLSAPITTKVV
jgi:hypothetical protein